MAQSLRFTVEVAADQATAALNAVSAAFNQAGIAGQTGILKLGTGAKAAGQEIETLGGKMRKFASEQRQEARVASFFVSELRSIIPVSGAASVALSGLGQALVGGLGVGTAIGVVITGASLLSQHLKEQEERQKRAAEAADTHAKSLRDLTLDTDAYLRSLQKAPASMQWMYGEMQKLNDEALPLQKKLAETQAELARLRDPNKWKSVTHGSDVADARQDIAELEARLADIEARREKVRTEFQRRTAGDEAVGAEEAATKAAANAKKAAKEREDAQRKAFEAAKKEHQERLALAENLDIIGQEAWSAAEDREREFGEWKKQFNAEVNEWVRQDEEKTLQSRAQAYTVLGQQIGATLGAIVTGQMTARQAVAQTLQLMIKEATAYAIAAAIGGAKSQATIPGIGPILAISTAGSLMATLMGMVGSMPSAKGGWWDTGSYEGLAMIHKREMVVPEREAEMLRNAAGRGGSGDVNFTIVTPDATGVGRMLRNSESTVSKELRRLQRKRRG